LTDDQRAMITTQWGRERIKQEAKERQKDQAEKGKEGGRGKKKTLGVKSPEGLANPEENRSRHKLAEMAGVSENKVRQAEKVMASSPELAVKVTSGELKRAICQLPVLGAGPALPREAAGPIPESVKAVAPASRKLKARVPDLGWSDRAQFDLRLQRVFCKEPVFIRRTLRTTSL
jgi:hypothetical protein